MSNCLFIFTPIPSPSTSSHTTLLSSSSFAPPLLCCFSHHTFQTLLLSNLFSPRLLHLSLSLPPFPSSVFPLFLYSATTQRPPGASPSAHNISSAAVSDRANFSRGVGIRSTFHAGQQRGARDQQGSAYPGGPASPSLSHGNSQARRTHGATGIFSKFTSKFVRR